LGDPAPPGGTPGDAYIEVQVRQDPRFKVDGDNLITDLPISLDTAVFGGEVRAPTLDGEVLLKIPPRSNTGTLLRLSGKGLTNRSTQQRGDELVSLRLMLPEKIDPELEDALRKWKERQHQEAQRKGAA
jgi:DnaJ-class molecular chaperone